MSKVWTSLFLKTSSKGSFTVSSGRGIAASPSYAYPYIAFLNTCQRKGCIPFPSPQRKSGWAGPCTCYHSCLRTTWWCKINILSTELEKMYPCLQKIKVQLAFFKMLPEFVLLLFKKYCQDVCFRYSSFKFFFPSLLFWFSVITRNIQEYLEKKKQWELLSLLNVFALCGF